MMSQDEKMEIQTIKAHCNKCLGMRNHEILFQLNFEEGDGYTEPCFYTKHELLRCLGCEQITYRISEWNDMEVDKDKNYIFKMQYYPPAISRNFPSWLSNLKHFGYMEKTKEKRIEQLFVHDLLKEIYIGLQNNSIRLATMGIRTLLESIMIHKVGDKHSFKNNLNEFEKNGYISQKQNMILNSVLETGHATLHRDYSPSKRDLLTCMDITENLIASIYIHPIEAERLKKKIPPRNIN